MSKQEFLQQLRYGLNGLPTHEIEERVSFYTEMIDDKIEEGLSEEEAVKSIGPVEGIISQILADIPLSRCIKEKITPKRKLGTAEIVLLVLGSPIWLSLLLAFASILFSVYISLWAVVISLWTAFGSLIICSISGMAASVLYIFEGHGIICLAYMGESLVCMGIAIFMFFGCKAATKGTVLLLKNLLLWIKGKFIKKEEYHE